MRNVRWPRRDRAIRRGAAHCCAPRHSAVFVTIYRHARPKPNRPPRLSDSSSARVNPDGRQRSVRTVVTTRLGKTSIGRSSSPQPRSRRGGINRREVAHPTRERAVRLEALLLGDRPLPLEFVRDPPRMSMTMSRTTSRNAWRRRHSRTTSAWRSFARAESGSEVTTFSLSPRSQSAAVERRTPSFVAIVTSPVCWTRSRSLRS